jgi:hypothetical protein
MTSGSQNISISKEKLIRGKHGSFALSATIKLLRHTALAKFSLLAIRSDTFEAKNCSLTVGLEVRIGKNIATSLRAAVERRQSSSREEFGGNQTR